MAGSSDEAIQLDSCHHPRKRMIQYSRGSDQELRGLGVLDTPHARGMT
jgi:hypothetical protein